MKMSVCLAAYNGEKYIYEQVASILAQMGEEDEIIICDDYSTDSTCTIVESFKDVRIKLYRNKQNIGHVKNFERAISFASGEIIVLSDQDDIWCDSKLKFISETFHSSRNISMICHSLSAIDSKGHYIFKNTHLYDDVVQKGLLLLIQQLIRPKCFGCAMAFRRSLLLRLLPFPIVVYAHDHWLTIVSAVCGSVLFSSRHLTLYRQHDSNLTPKARLSIFKSMGFRIKFIYLIFIAYWRFALR